MELNQKDKIDNLKELADTYFNENKYEESINHYTTLLNNLDNQNNQNDEDIKFKIYMNRCLAYYKLTNFELALEDAIKATKLNTNSGKAWSRVGSCLLELKKYYLSLSAFEKAKNLDPENELYKDLYENAYDTMKENKISEEYNEDTEEEKEEKEDNTEKEDNDNTEKEEKEDNTEKEDNDILNLTNKLKNLKNTEGLSDLLKDNNLNMPSNFVNGIFNSMLNNKNLINKLSQKDFQNKIVDYQKNPLAVFNDSEMMNLMNDIINKTKFDQ